MSTRNNTSALSPQEKPVEVAEKPSIVTECPHCRAPIGRMADNDVACPRGRRR